jgi:multimeric flavodoxin WrbA
MKIVALMGSPRKDGNTDLLTDEFFAGAQSEGAECEKIYLDDLNIRPIAAVGDDWKMRVDLRADDDARWVLDKVAAADIVVFASPVYWQGVTAQMKCLVDRFSAYYMADWLRKGMRGSGFFVVTAYGNPAEDESHWITEPVKVWARGFKAKYLGQVAAAVARWGAVAEMPEVLQEAREAGAEAVRAMENRDSHLFPARTPSNQVQRDDLRNR